MAKHDDKSCLNCGTVFDFEKEERPKECPVCGTPFWWNPPDEQELFVLQDAFLRAERDPEKLGPMYQKLLTYSENLIKNKMRNKFFMDSDYIEQKSNEVAMKVIEKYLANPEFVITTSFGGLMSKLVLGVLWGKARKTDQDESLNQKIFDGESELESQLYSLASNPLSLTSGNREIESTLDDSENLMSDIRYRIDRPYEIVSEYKNSENFFYLLGLLHSFSGKPDEFMREYYNLAGSRVKQNIEGTRLLLHNYLKGVQSPMSNKLFENPTEVFEEQLNDIFVKSKNEDSNSIIRVLNLLLYSNTKNQDMIDLYNLLGVDGFVSVISLFEGRTVKFPKKQEVQDDLVLALVYYYREIENLSWTEIERKLPFEFSSISYSMRIKNLNSSIIRQVEEIMRREKK